MFRSAAHAYGPRVAGVILTGNLDDGTSGLWEVKRFGGVAIVQDPEEAHAPPMPRSALANVPVDYVVKLKDLAPLLTDLASRPPRSDPIMREHEELTLTALICPECRGPLSELKEGKSLEFRCRVGHAYSPAALIDAHDETEERTLWAGVVALEGAELAERLRQVLTAEQQRLGESAQAKRALAAQLRSILEQNVRAAPET